MQRLSGDRGAVGVLVALLIVPLLVFAALVVDVGADYLQRRQLQNAADAAALAIAGDCGRGSCGSITTTATTFTVANVRSGSATATPVLSGNTVTVSTSSVVDYLFAPVMGINNKTVTARSSAAWGSPTGGQAVLPLAFSWCSFKAQTGGGLPTSHTPVLLSKTDGTSCTGPSGNMVPGGFGWLAANTGDCTATSTISAAQTNSDPGNSVPSSCQTSDFSAMLNQTVLLPVYDTAGGTGSGAWYHIYAYAAYRLTGYYFGGQFKANAPCSGNARCIQGYFTVFVDPSQAFTYGAGNPDLGARVVTLTA